MRHCVLTCVQALLVEMARIRLHGFSDREMSQARASMMSDVESAYIERDQDYSQVSSPDDVQFICASSVADVNLGSQGKWYPCQSAGYRHLQLGKKVCSVNNA